MRRLFVMSLGVVLTLGAAGVWGATAANAAYPPPAPTTTVASGGSGAVSNPSIPQGGIQTVTFTGLVANGGYDVQVNSTTIDLGTHFADANGVMTVSFSTAGLAAGSHTVQAIGNGQDVVVSFVVTAPATTPTSTTPTTSSGLAFTGAQVAGLVALALVLLAVGFVALRAGRRRRTSAS